MSFTAKDVMTLRERTGVGMMDCKKALTETDGDMEKAIDLLREKGMATAAKKAGRVASEGIVFSHVNENKGVLLEVNCESDFVARGEAFVEFAKQVAEYILANSTQTLEEVVEAMTPVVNEATMRIGEKLSIRRFTIFDANNSKIDSYIHMGGKIGVLVETSENASDELIHDIALQIAAAKPSYICSDEVPGAEIEKEKEILKAQALNEEHPKPMNIIEKMIEGRISKYYKEVCLIEQVFVKNSDLTIKQYLKSNDDAKIIRFVRYEMGEGLQKKEDNFAQEIMDQVNSLKK